MHTRYLRTPSLNGHILLTEPRRCSLNRWRRAGKRAIEQLPLDEFSTRKKVLCEDSWLHRRSLVGIVLLLHPPRAALRRALVGADRTPREQGADGDRYPKPPDRT